MKPKGVAKHHTKSSDSIEAQLIAILISSVTSVPAGFKKNSRTVSVETAQTYVASSGCHVLPLIWVSKNHINTGGLSKSVQLQ